MLLIFPFVPISEKEVGPYEEDEDSKCRVVDRPTVNLGLDIQARLGVDHSRVRKRAVPRSHDHCRPIPRCLISDLSGVDCDIGDVEDGLRYDSRDHEESVLAEVIRRALDGTRGLAQAKHGDGGVGPGVAETVARGTEYLEGPVVIGRELATRHGERDHDGVGQ